MAVSVTIESGQKGLPPPVTAIESEGVNDELTTMVIALEVAVLVVRQEAFDVMIHLITLPFVIVLDVYTGLLVPTLVVPDFH